MYCPCNQMYIIGTSTGFKMEDPCNKSPNGLVLLQLCGHLLGRLCPNSEAPSLCDVSTEHKSLTSRAKPQGINIYFEGVMMASCS